MNQPNEWRLVRRFLPAPNLTSTAFDILGANNNLSIIIDFVAYSLPRAIDKTSLGIDVAIIQLLHGGVANAIGQMPLLSSRGLETLVDIGQSPPSVAVGFIWRHEYILGGRFGSV